MCSSFVSVRSKASPYKYVGRACSYGRWRLGGVECGSAVLSVRGGDSTTADPLTDTAIDVSSTYSCCLHSHMFCWATSPSTAHHCSQRPQHLRGHRVVIPGRRSLHVPGAVAAAPQYLPWWPGTPSHNSVLPFGDIFANLVAPFAAFGSHSSLWPRPTRFYRLQRPFLRPLAVIVCCGQRPQQLRTPR